jgi:DNA-binding response OmpR family regulator
MSMQSETEASTTPDPSAAVPQVAQEAMKPVILVVDDSWQLATAVKFRLERTGYRVVTASDGVEALSLLNSVAPDLIVADIMMPRLDGFGLYERLRAEPRWTSIPIIFLTAASDLLTVVRGKSLGVDDYITKPFQFNRLLESIQGKLQHQRELATAPTAAPVEPSG